MSLTHEVEQNEKVRLIKATSWLIMLVTDSNRLLVVNWAATILYIEQINEPVSDIAITESG